jgi:hypothetical protein
MSLFMSESSSLLPPSPLRCRSCFIPQFPLSHPSRSSSSLAPASVSNHLLQPFCFLFRVPFGFPVYHPVTCLSDFFRLPGPVQAVFASTAFTTIVDKTVLGKTTAETLLPPSVCVSDIFLICPVEASISGFTRHIRNPLPLGAGGVDRQLDAQSAYELVLLEVDQRGD